MPSSFWDESLTVDVFVWSDFSSALTHLPMTAKATPIILLITHINRAFLSLPHTYSFTFYLPDGQIYQFPPGWKMFSLLLSHSTHISNASNNRLLLCFYIYIYIYIEENFLLRFSFSSDLSLQIPVFTPVWCLFLKRVTFHLLKAILQWSKTAWSTWVINLTTQIFKSLSLKCH